MKHKRILLLSFYLLQTCFCYAQYQAANWVVPVSRKVITIKPGVFTVDTLKWGVSSFVTCSSISTNSGELVAFSTGIDVRNREGNYIDDGWNLCDPGTPPQCFGNCDAGIPFYQGTMFLPKHGSIHQYYLFIKDKGVTSNCQPSRVTATLIDMSYNNGLGKVLQKTVPILNDTLSDSRMTACKHANGRDWWLVNHEYNTNRIYTHLITPDSIYGPYSQYIGGGGIEPDYGGWSIFSPDGTRFATVTAGMSNYNTGTGITLLDFDRCSGMFTNYRAIKLDTTMVTYYSAFLAFSPNGRFLYSGSNNYLYQYDIATADISASGVQLVYDSMPPYLGMMSLMPDGKIYMPGWSGSTTGLDGCFSVVNEPDLKAPACNLQVRSVCVAGAVQIQATPNFPNYNLGALAGSGCDSLTDIKTEKQETRKQPRVFPNPANEQVEIELPQQGSYEIYLLNTAGQLIEKKAVAKSVIIDTQNLPSGIYFLRVTDTNDAYYYHATKLIVQH
jgi:hypothetical protein